MELQFATVEEIIEELDRRKGVKYSLMVSYMDAGREVYRESVSSAADERELITRRVEGLVQELGQHIKELGQSFLDREEKDGE